jgi:thymidine phosphorylase
VCSRGARVQAGDSLAQVHAATPEAATAAVREVRAAFTIADQAPAPNPLIHGRIA